MGPVVCKVKYGPLQINVRIIPYKMKNIVAIASGKGGVGKSTLAVNLAAVLANADIAPEGRALKVALIDVDFCGPSVPTLMGGGELGVDADEKLIPALRHGVKYISIGFFLRKPDDPVIWRGPRFSKAITQLFEDVNWGDIDICLVDLPPGTGDAQLSLAQQVSLSGAVMVTTPQEVSLSDVRKAVNMFRTVNVPVIGVVENMSGFVTPTGERFEIFGSGGGKALADQYHLPFLGAIPIEIAIREGGDCGVPAVLGSNSQTTSYYQGIAQAVVESLEEMPHSSTVVVDS